MSELVSDEPASEPVSEPVSELVSKPPAGTIQSEEESSTPIEVPHVTPIDVSEVEVDTSTSPEVPQATSNEVPEVEVDTSTSPEFSQAIPDGAPQIEKEISTPTDVQRTTPDEALEVEKPSVNTVLSERHELSQPDVPQIPPDNTVVPERHELTQPDVPQGHLRPNVSKIDDEVEAERRPDVPQGQLRPTVAKIDEDVEAVQIATQPAGEHLVAISVDNKPGQHNVPQGQLRPIVSKIDDEIEAIQAEPTQPARVRSIGSQVSPLQNDHEDGELKWSAWEDAKATEAAAAPAFEEHKSLSSSDGLPQAIFPDLKAMKETMKDNLLTRPYDVCDFYWDEGFCQKVARDQTFEHFTLGVISFNALWISIDTQYNNAEVLNDALPTFIVAEQFFTVFFVFEWAVRFGSFKSKVNCLKDAWFMFDSALCGMMAVENWILFMIIAVSGGGLNLGNASTLKLVRLLRLSRMARMAKLLRSMPELLILIKGIGAASRAVFFTLLFLTLVLYVFGIIFTQLTAGSDMGERHFRSVTLSMHTLLTYGVFLDSVTLISFGLAGSSQNIDEGEAVYPHSFTRYVLIVCWYAFIVIASLMLMQMLIGVMCEVISAVAKTEKEEMTMHFVRTQLENILGRHFGSDFMAQHDIYDEYDEFISKRDFLEIFVQKETALLLEDIDVDVYAIADVVDVIFASEDGVGEQVLSFEALLMIMLDQRKIKQATVKDITVLRKYVNSRLAQIKNHMKMYEDRERQSRIGLEARCQVLGGWLEKVGKYQEGYYKEEFRKESRKRLREYHTKKAKECGRTTEDLVIRAFANAGHTRETAQVAAAKFLRPIRKVNKKVSDKERSMASEGDASDHVELRTVVTGQ